MGTACRTSLLPKRLGAALLDFVLAWAPPAVPALALGLEGLGSLGHGFAHESNPLWPPLYVVCVGWGVLYTLLRDCLPLGSIGKRSFGLIARVRSSHARPGILRSMLRNFGLLLVFPIVPLIELLLLGSEGRGRRLGDRLADTEVTDR